jgi:hypothetical protein
MEFDAKIIRRDGLLPRQELNVAAFLASVAGEAGEPCEDADGNKHLPMNREPMLILPADGAKLKEVRRKAVERGMQAAVCT